MKPQSAAQGTFWRLIAGVVQLVGLYFVHSMIAKKMGAEVYGLFGVLFSIVLWLRIFVSSGMATALIKFLPDRSFSGTDVFRKNLLLHMVLAVLLGLLLWFASPLL